MSMRAVSAFILGVVLLVGAAVAIGLSVGVGALERQASLLSCPPPRGLPAGYVPAVDVVTLGDDAAGAVRPRGSW
jgi:hypothetical protein